ncbi:MAG TPA: endonuclease MutS2 [Deinococcales bacterium]|nr:endonuclease MutS2 [Deinococcales bacterium]
MPIGSRALAVVEFGRVREALADRAATRLGRERALGLMPTSDGSQVRVALERVEDALFGVSLSLGGITDVRAAIAGLTSGEGLNAQEIGSSLLEVANTLDAAMNLKRSVANHSRGPLLVVAERIGAHVPLARGIQDKIDPQGLVRDEASPKLRAVRRRLNPLREEIRQRLSSLMDRHAEALQDRLVTIRRDRYVIPVKASLEASVPGIVVDSSSSSQTVFMEPASVVPLNNELAKLLLDEEHEVARVLFELSRAVSEEPGIFETLDAIAELDLVAAKAALAREWRLTRPVEAEAGCFDVSGMRHPFIEGCVENDLKLSDEHKLLLITGPNMGGKTVSLKTLGLLTLMHQAGLYVPANRASLPMVEDVLVDVGDEQSIEASLSTFAGHLRNLALILAEAGPKTLVLIDELGSGTDPEEGAALSQAVIECLLEREARGVVTSHLAPLKAFAAHREDVQNASMGFDLERLAPTYKLNVGQPGRSYALAIAGRLGFPKGVLSRARDVLGPQGLSVEQLLISLEQERERLERDTQVAREARATAERDAQAARARLEALERERDTFLQQARERAEGLYRDAFEQVRQLKVRARENDVERPRILNELRELRAAAQRERPQMTAVQREPEVLQPGVTVDVPGYGATGTVLDVRGDDVIVQMGLLKVTLKRREVRSRRPNGAPVKTAYTPAPRNFSKELNLRGSHVEEAIEEVRSFITEAAALKESPVRILHGKGEGVLRRLIRDYLKTDRRVESFHDANPNEGGHGVTIAHLRM